MKKILIIEVLLVTLFAGVYVFFFYYKNFRGVKSAITDPPADIAEIIEENNNLPPRENVTGFPLSLSPGFKIEVLAKNLAGARVLAMDSRGNLWVSRTRDGIVTVLDLEDGKVVEQADMFTGLNNPHGLAFDPSNLDDLFIAEEHRVAHVVVYPPPQSPVNADERISDIELIRVALAIHSAPIPYKIVDLPEGSGARGHFTRTIKFGSDGRLYVSVGSSCNVCIEKDDRRAKILVMNKDGSNMKEYARGLRNAVFFTWSYVDGRMWATEMGRDGLGDDVPPDEINIIAEGNNYGWPICYGNNIHDDEFDKNTYIRNPCMEPFETPSRIDLQAHVAPLGLGFIPEEGWPEDMRYDLLVAQHGSWNRSVPVGYKIVRLKLDAKGNYEGVDDFISGWLTKDNKALGRPVDILIQPGGVMYISDDRAGVVYKMSNV